jgi:hypothetical protein
MSHERGTYCGVWQQDASGLTAEVRELRSPPWTNVGDMAKEKDSQGTESRVRQRTGQAGSELVLVTPESYQKSENDPLSEVRSCSAIDKFGNLLLAKD